MSSVHRPRQSTIYSPWPAIPMKQAWDLLDQQVSQHLEQLRIVDECPANDLQQLLGVVLAEPISATRPVPSFRASIKDGYALIASDGSGPRRVVSSSTAGGREGTGKPSIKLETGQCVRISTGARVPEGADAVVQVENTKLLEHDGREELLVDIGVIPRHGQDIREVGSDVAVGQLLLAHGTMLGPAEIGLLALSGRQSVRIFRRPRVSVLSTGDELVDSLGPAKSGPQEPPPDAVVDTNRPVLLALLRSAGFDPHDCGIAVDCREVLTKAVETALTRADVLVVSGGVSMGEKDLLKELLQSQFRFCIHFGRVFMKPGLPSTFASGMGSDGRPKLVFGLPGNPVSALVTAHLFVLPQLRRIGGKDTDWRSARIAVKLAQPVAALDARPEYRRAVLCQSVTGGTALPMAEPISGSQMSSRLLSARSANLLLELPAANEQKQALEQGETVSALVIGPL